MKRMKRFNITVNGTAYDVQVEEIAAGAAAVFALKKHKELEDYDYEELDEDFDDCCCDECCDCEEDVVEETAETVEAETDVEAELDKVEEPVEETDE